MKCLHKGVVRNKPSQAWVTIEKDSVLVDNDPEGRDIDRCPNRGPHGIKPCGKTLQGTSGLLDLHSHRPPRRVPRQPLGSHRRTPPGVVKYNVIDPGQKFVAGVA